MPEPRPAPMLIRQTAPLLALAVCAGGVFGFIELMEVLEGDGRRFDEAVLLALRNPADPADPIGPRWLELAVRDITALGGIPVLGLLSLLALGWLVLRRRWRSVVLLFLALPGGLLVNTLLKRGFDRPRPGLVAHLVEVGTSSFPSGHAMLSAIGFLTLGALMAGGAIVDLVAPRLGTLKSREGDKEEPVKTFLTAHSVLYDAVYVPGGEKSIATLSLLADAVDFVRDAYRHCKAVGFSGEATQLVEVAGLSKIATMQPLA